MSLTESRVRYQTDGFYLHRESVLSGDLIRRAVSGQDALARGEYETGVPPQPSYWNPGDDPKKLIKIEMPQLANRAIMEVVSHAAIGNIAAAITGAEWVQVWWVQHLVKPPILPGEDAKTNVGWHQDRNYWGIWEDGSELLTAWVALTNVTEEAGPMRFLRGSHRWGYLSGSDFWRQDTDAQHGDIPVPEGEMWEEVPAILAPGAVSFHHNLTFHGSGPNHSGCPRRSFALHLRTEKSRPVNDERKGLSQFIDDVSRCPVIFSSKERTDQRGDA